MGTKDGKVLNVFSNNNNNNTNDVIDLFEALLQLANLLLRLSLLFWANYQLLIVSICKLYSEAVVFLLFCV